MNMMTREHLWVCGLALTLLACTGGGTAPAAGEDAGDVYVVDTAAPDVASGEDIADATLPNTVTYLTSTQHLIRASMALRGSRPSLEELETVAADPATLEGIVRGYVETEAFGVSIRDLENETLLVRSENFRMPGNGSLEGVQAQNVNTAMTETPLRTIEWVVLQGRPYTDILSVDVQVANEHASQVWQGLAAYDPSGPEWQPLKFADGRPPAGILSDGAFWFRHRSAGINYHRGRANVVARSLLCFDYLAQDIVLEETIDLSDPDAVANAVVENSSCASCHQSLDPLASFLWVNRQNWGAGSLNFPLGIYMPGNKDRWVEATGRAPGYFGLGGNTMTDLGQLIAADPRFSLCTARRYFSYLAQVPLAQTDAETVASYQQVLVDSGFDVREMSVAIVLSDAFRQSHSSDEATAEALVGYKKTRPGQLERLFADLTGLEWQTYRDNQFGGMIDLLTNDFYGFRVLGGGIDSLFVLKPVHTMNTTASLVVQEVAKAGASQVVSEDLAISDATQRRLLTQLDISDLANETNGRAQLAQLHLQLFGVKESTDSEAVSLSWNLFSELYAHSGDVHRAWTLTLTALFQDMRVAHH
jgi:hypothetical protein